MRPKWGGKPLDGKTGEANKCMTVFLFFFPPSLVGMLVEAAVTRCCMAVYSLVCARVCVWVHKECCHLYSLLTQPASFAHLIEVSFRFDCFYLVGCTDVMNSLHGFSTCRCKKKKKKGGGGGGGGGGAIMIQKVELQQGNRLHYCPAEESIACWCVSQHRHDVSTLTASMSSWWKRNILCGDVRGLKKQQQKQKK